MPSWSESQQRRSSSALPFGYFEFFRQQDYPLDKPKWSDKGLYNACNANTLYLPLLLFRPVPFFAQRTRNFGYFVANLRTFWCTFTGLNDAVVPQN